jgi:hypothetical protein
VNTFQFFRYRWHFRALDPVRFPAGKSSNLIRGAFGLLLRRTASPEVYRKIFEPGHEPAKSPSGLADWPRPFLFRTGEVDGLTVAEGGTFQIDMHVFDLHSSFAGLFGDVFQQLAHEGLGPGRGRVRVEKLEQLDPEERVTTGPCVVPLDAQGPTVDRVELRFVTPTELKAAGEIVEEPQFGILFARLRDRIATLSSLYGEGPLAIDFAGVGAQSSVVRLVRSRLEWQRTERRSTRTGQDHWMGGFTGEAEYEGDLGRFLPWLRAARWTGVGRQTVWGKGDVRVVS